MHKPLPLLFCMFLLLALAAHASAQTTEVFSGSYVLTETSADDTRTLGLEITYEAEHDLYIAQRQTSDGWERAYGFAVDGVLGLAGGDPNCSVGVFHLTGDGFQGRWASERQGAILELRGTQTASEPQTYAVEGQDAAGVPFDGTLTLDGATITLLTGQVGLRGVAQVVEGVLMAAFGEAACTSFTYQPAASGLRGRVLGTALDLQAAAEPLHVGGRYRVSGLNPDDSPYDGELVIDSGSPLRFDWRIADTTYRGIGLQRGSVLGAAYGPGLCGVGIYARDFRSGLVGAWVEPGMSAPGLEVVRAIGAAEVGFAGDYAVELRRAAEDSARLSGTLSIIPTQSAGLYDLVWNFQDGTSLSGSGIDYLGALVAGFGDEGCGVAAYLVTVEGIAGMWAQLGGDFFGIEAGEAQ